MRYNNVLQYAFYVMPSLFFLRTILGVSPPGKSVEYRYLKAISCRGSYSPGGVYSEYLRALRLKQEVEIDEGFVKGEREMLPSFYLAPTKIVSEECSLDDGFPKCILRNLIPVPIRSGRDDIVPSIAAAMQKETKTSISWSTAAVTDRNRGIHDNIIPLLSRIGKINSRKQMIEEMRLRKTEHPSPYHCYLEALSECTGLKVTGLIIEVADTINEVSLSLGAAVLLSKSEVAKDWILKTSNYKTITRAEKSSKDARFVECYMVRFNIYSIIYQIFSFHSY